jgi:tetratricopeptide (TPR) repeat protein
MKRHLILASSLAFAALVPAAAAQDKETELVKAYAALAPHAQKAQTALRKDRVDKCEEEALFCLGRLPEHESAHLMMSQVLYKRGDFAAALTHIEAAEAGYLRMVRAVAVLEQERLKGRVDQMAGAIDEVSALAEADAAAKARGSCQPDRYSKDLQDARGELAKGQEEQAASHPDRALARVPALYSHWHGNVLFRLQRPREAEAQYRLAIQNDPNFREAYNNLVNLLYTGGRIDEARAFLAQAEAHKAKVHPELKKAVLEHGRR